MEENTQGMWINTWCNQSFKRDFQNSILKNKYQPQKCKNTIFCSRPSIKVCQRVEIAILFCNRMFPMSVLATFLLRRLTLPLAVFAVRLMCSDSSPVFPQVWLLAMSPTGSPSVSSSRCLVLWCWTSALMRQKGRFGHTCWTWWTVKNKIWPLTSTPFQLVRSRLICCWLAAAVSSWWPSCDWIDFSLLIFHNLPLPLSYQSWSSQCNCLGESTCMNH